MLGSNVRHMTADDNFRRLVDAHERALRAHCYRMLGSIQDAEDLTQETLLRAWRNLNSFEGRASVRGWLYRIATYACLDELRRRTRRLLPPMIGSPSAAFMPGALSAEQAQWLDPFPDAWLDVADSEPGPEARYEVKEAIELAFVAVLQLLPARQRAVLVLRDVLGWPAQDVASLLDMSVAAANSALQRARARLDRSGASSAQRLSPAAESALVARYVHAWEHSDLEALVALLRDDAVLSMPPLAEWYLGREAIGTFFAWAFGPGSEGRFQFVPTRANNAPAFGIYGPDQRPFILHVLGARADGIASITSFMKPGLFPAFGLPERL